MKLEDRVKALEDVWALALHEQKLRVEQGGVEDLAQRLAKALGPIQEVEAQLGMVRDEMKGAMDLHKSELQDLIYRTKDELTSSGTATAVNSKEQAAGMERCFQDLAVLSAWRVKHEMDPEAHGHAHAAPEAREAQLLKEALEHQAEMLAKHDSDINEMRGSKVAGAFSSTSTMAQKKFQPCPEEPRSDLQVYSDRAEWLIRDAAAVKSTLPKGEAMESPHFNLEVPGIGHLHGLFLRFFPNGALHAQQEDACSLYLAHPLDMPWSKYELAVGRTVQGPFDPIFGGTDDFCSFSANLSQDEAGQFAVCIGVRFLAKDVES